MDTRSRSQPTIEVNTTHHSADPAHTASVRTSASVKLEPAPSPRSAKTAANDRIVSGLVIVSAKIEAANREQADGADRGRDREADHQASERQRERDFHQVLRFVGPDNHARGITTPSARSPRAVVTGSIARVGRAPQSEPSLIGIGCCWDRAPAVRIDIATDDAGFQPPVQRGPAGGPTAASRARNLT